jgi:hypothetical protein
VPAVEAPAEAAEAVALPDGDRDNAAGVLPLKKWMYRNGPATARTATTTMAAMSHLSQ